MSIHQIDGKSTLGVGQDVAIRREDAEVESQGIGEDRDHEQNSAEHEAEADEAEEEDQVPAVAPPTSTSAANARTTFGLKKPKPAINRGNDTYDYEQKYPEDAPYAETAPNARVWRTHEDESRIHGTNMVEEARDNVDVLLVFAGLFSAVVTTFVSQTYQNLQVDYAAMSASLLYESVLVQRAIANGSPVNSIAASPLNPTITFVPATTDVWVNGLWFTSLFLSLTTALVAVLVKQWLHHYVALPSGTPRDRSFTRQFRYAGFQKWHVPVIIGLLPVLMHLALAIFLAGLVIFLQPLRQALSWAIFAGTVLVYIAYVVANILPILFPQCPYRTPLCDLIRCIIPLVSWDDKEKFFYAWRQGELGSIFYYLPYIQVGNRQTLAMRESKCVRRTSTDLAADALDWLFSVSSNPSVQSIIVQSIGGLPIASEERFLALRAYDETFDNLQLSLLRDCLLVHSDNLNDYVFAEPVPGIEHKVGRLLRFGPPCNHPWYSFYITPNMDFSDIIIAILIGHFSLSDRETLESVHSTPLLMDIVRSSKLPPRCWYRLMMAERNFFFSPLDPGRDNHSNTSPLHICSAFLKVFDPQEVAVAQDFDLPLVLDFEQALPHFIDKISEHIFDMFSKFIKEPSLCDPSLPPSLRTLAAVIRFLLHRFPPSEFNLPRATIWWPLRVAISVIPHRTSYQEATAVITMLEDIIISCTIESLNITPDWDDLCNVTIRTYQYLATIAPSAYSLHGVRSMIEFMTIHWDQQWRSGPACAALTNLLAKRIPVAFLAFLESQCLQFLGSHTFHEESVPVVREYVAGIFTWHHPSDGAVDESTLQAHVEYLHDPHNLFTTCSILATQGFKSTDRTAIHRDIMALVQLSPRDAAWGECHKKLCDLVQDDGADFFAEQRVRESDGDVRPLRIDEIQAEKANIRYAIQVLDDFFDGRAHTSIAHLDHFLARWLRRKPEDKPEQEQPV